MQEVGGRNRNSEDSDPGNEGGPTGSQAKMMSAAVDFRALRKGICLSPGGFFSCLAYAISEATLIKNLAKSRLPSSRTMHTTRYGDANLSIYSFLARLPCEVGLVLPSSPCILFSSSCFLGCALGRTVSSTSLLPPRNQTTSGMKSYPNSYPFQKLRKPINKERSAILGAKWALGNL